MSAAVVQQTGSSALPRLRRDIRVENGGVDSDGHPVMLLVDPVCSNYFRVTWPTCGILACWQNGETADQLAARVRKTMHFDMTPEDFDALLKFLFASQLTLNDEQGTWSRYDKVAKSGQHGLLMSLVHNYLFFRIPLFRPDAFLRQSLPYISFLYSGIFIKIFSVLVLVGLYLISREWDTFVAMFWHMTKLQSITLYAAVLLVLKAIHELGHAYTTARFGCRVPTMGIAFMLGAPVFYTDTTDSWRLVSRRQRLAIVTAGVGAEFLVAGCAIILWPFLSNGLMREICFAVMTSTLVTTLLVNLNPCMRFDGYFALSDMLGVANLQARSFALARWKMRELLFNLGEPVPEQHPPKMQSTLIGYAWLVWVYRLFLFCGIAAVVYAMTVKVIGIALGLFEIVMFVARPVLSEVLEWWSMRKRILGNSRSMVTLGVAALGLALVFTPWLKIVEVPVVLSASNEETIHLRMPARIEKVNVTEGQVVRAGDVLFVAESPELRSRLQKAIFEVQSAEGQMNRLAGSDKERSSRLIVENQVVRARERLAALKRLEKDLVVRAPFDGAIVDLDPDLQKGVWQGVGRELARVVAEEGVRARGLVSDTDVMRLHVGSQAMFVPDDAGGNAVPLQLQFISAINDKRLSEPALANIYGGTIDVTEEKNEIVPKSPMYSITLSGEGIRPSMIMRGVVRLQANAESPFTHAWRQVARVVVREQNF